MKGLKTTIGTLLGIASAWLILSGLLIVVQTMGRVTGSEFGMLITLASVVSSIALWIGLFGLWVMIPTSTGSDEGGVAGNGS